MSFQNKRLVSCLIIVSVLFFGQQALSQSAIPDDKCAIITSYAQKLVTVRLGGVLKLLDPVLELNPLNDFWQSICAAELPPFLLG